MIIENRFNIKLLKNDYRGNLDYLHTQTLSDKDHELTEVVEFLKLGKSLLSQKTLGKNIPNISKNPELYDFWHYVYKFSTFLVQNHYTDSIFYSHDTKKFAITKDYKKLLRNTKLDYKIRNSLEARLYNFQQTMRKGRYYGMPDNKLAYILTFENLFIDVTYYTGLVFAKDFEIFHEEIMNSKLEHF